jgi:hypothetical protein
VTSQKDDLSVCFRINRDRNLFGPRVGVVCQRRLLSTLGVGGEENCVCAAGAVESQIDLARWRAEQPSTLPYRDPKLFPSFVNGAINKPHGRRFVRRGQITVGALHGLIQGTILIVGGPEPSLDQNGSGEGGADRRTRTRTANRIVADRPTTRRVAKRLKSGSANSNATCRPIKTGTTKSNTISRLGMRWSG